MVKESQARIAIGGGGFKIRNLERIIGKRVEVLEYSSDPIRFVQNIFYPIKLRSCEIRKEGGRSVLRIVTSKSSALVGVKLKKARLMLQKYFGIRVAFG